MFYYRILSSSALLVVAVILTACADKAALIQNEEEVVRAWSPSQSFDLTPTELAELTELANHGDISAAKKLGKSYLFGYRDDVMAVYWLNRAAISGDPEAQFGIAGIYSGHEHLKGEAIYWMRLAAKNNYNGAKRALRELEQEKSKKLEAK